MKYEVTIRGNLVIEAANNERNHDEMLEEAFDFTMREMLKLADLHDPSATGSVTSGGIVLAAVVDASNYGEAVSTADVAMRSALHAAGVGKRGHGKRRLRTFGSSARASKLKS